MVLFWTRWECEQEQLGLVASCAFVHPNVLELKTIKATFYNNAHTRLNEKRTIKKI